MALTEVYVDADIGGSSGSGTIGDPYSDLEYAFTQYTHSGPMRVNVKGTQVLTGQLTPAAGPSASAPLIIEGYTSAAGDGGFFEVDVNGGTFNARPTTLYTHVRNMKLYNAAPTSFVWYTTTGQTTFNCEFSNITGKGVKLSNSNLARCYFYDISSVGFEGSYAWNCFFQNGTKKFTTAVNAGSAFDSCFFNLDGSSNAITQGFYGLIKNCSIFSNGGTGHGLNTGSSEHSKNWVYNLLVEGFSGASGHGIGWGARNMFGSYNAVYNCETEYANGPDEAGVDNESLSVSPFAKTGTLPTTITAANFWADVEAWFTPVDTGNVLSGIAGAKGAVPAAAAAGGGGCQVIRGTPSF